MEIIIQPDAQSAAVIGARIIARLVREKPAAVLGLATGSTPLPLYRELIRLHREEGLSFAGVTTFNLDEYAGLAPGHPASYHAFMHENLFAHIDVPKENIHIPDGLAADIPRHCLEYEAAIRNAGGIDIQVLGIGSDGHIGFNEPTSSLASRTRIKTLTPRTKKDNARFFGSESDVPSHVITTGVGTIMDARQVLLIGTGENKAQAIADSCEGPVTALVPASVLQFHPAATVLLDEPAASRLRRTDYYRWVYDNKPDWQRV
jgi:glucosamine-6-phosphate deaminase